MSRKFPIQSRSLAEVDPPRAPNPRHKNVYDPDKRVRCPEIEPLPPGCFAAYNMPLKSAGLFRGTQPATHVETETVLGRL